MFVSCLLPTYNRMGTACQYLLEESVASFLNQTYKNSELIILNDTPGQVVVFKHPNVRVFNSPERFPTLSEKIQFMIDRSRGSACMRWDDDDICLPHRIQMSVKNLENRMEWRSSNHWYMENNKLIKETPYAGNSHVHSIWRKEVLEAMGGKYPQRLSGNEDQVFNKWINLTLGDYAGDRLSQEEIYYIYRWGTGSSHLSGKLGGPISNPHQGHYDEIGRKPILQGAFTLSPVWRVDYVQLVKEFLDNSFNEKNDPRKHR